MEEVDIWLNRAEEDFHTAEVNLKEKIFDASAFYSQQAAEKALKAFYILKYKRLWKIHDLFELAKRVSAPSSISNICEKLTQHYIATRYPPDIKYSEQDATEAIAQSRKVIEWVKERLSKA